MITNILTTVGGLIEDYQQSQNLGKLENILQLLKEGKFAELNELLKLKFFYGSKLIDDGIILNPYVGPEKTNKELLEKFIALAREQGFIFAYNHTTTGYDSGIESQGLLKEKMTESPKEIYLPILPAGTMTKKEMFAQIKIAGKKHLHSVSTAIRTAISLLEYGFYKPGQENGSWTLFFLETNYKEVPCKLHFGLGSDGKFYVSVFKVSETSKWSSPRVGLPLSN